MKHKQYYDKLIEYTYWLEGKPYWLITRNSQAKKDELAGSLNSLGYRRINLKINKKQKTILAHRLMFYKEHGYLPDIIDHINRDPDDNRIDNLREASALENVMNRKFSKGTSKYKGVSLDRSRMKWKAQINLKGTRTHIGYFNSEVEAAEAYDLVALKEYGKFAYLNFSV
jgi:hypothetical protein